MELIRALNGLLSYVEENLCGDIDIEEAARRGGYSTFYLQRAFSAMTQMPLSEYIRCRRLSRAAEELRFGKAKVVDMALKYGYETPESFQKAFRRFHGVTPSAAAKSNIQLRYMNPLQIQINLTGGTIMDYSIEKIAPLYVMGMERSFNYDSAFGEIPAFWTEYYQKGYNKQVPGYIGACFDGESCPEFAYMIGCFCGEGDMAPEGFVKREIPAYTWAKFRAVGKMPAALQSLNRQIFTQWLPSSEKYELAGAMNLEIYTEGDMDSEDYVSEIWIPVKEK